MYSISKVYEILSSTLVIIVEITERFLVPLYRRSISKKRHDLIYYCILKHFSRIHLYNLNNKYIRSLKLPTDTLTCSSSRRQDKSIRYIDASSCRAVAAKL